MEKDKDYDFSYIRWRISRFNMNVCTIYKFPVLLSQSPSIDITKLNWIQSKSTNKKKISKYSLQVHPCGRYRHNTVVFILAKEYNLKNLRTIHRLDRLTSGLLLFGRSPKKARQMEHQIRNRLVQKQYMCRVEGDFPE